MNTTQKGEYIVKLAFQISLIFYSGSLLLDCYCTSNSDCQSSFLALLTGWMGLPLGWVFLSWLANPFLWFAWFKRKSIKTSLILSVIATIFAFLFLFHSTIIVNEAGSQGRITDYKMGYWFWLLSSVLMLFGTAFRLLESKMK